MSIIRKTKEKINQEINEQAVKKLKRNEKYIDNQSQIEIIKKVLTDHAEVPTEIIDKLIIAVKENAIMEYKAEHSKDDNSTIKNVIIHN